MQVLFLLTYRGYAGIIVAHETVARATINKYEVTYATIYEDAE